ncbi:Helix-turn-helix [Marivirga sericea]|uniref:Helix-turn-helix n=1 Tax=Marivirga sericea TaxID=1028 RepID=A0A1X7IT21_9BACT|nr:helix-turn-helix transcriptional regulator [Marivirga sericea]SMG18198.1 Helix-turn-helix [Marivirga sericea]
MTKNKTKNLIEYHQLKELIDRHYIKQHLRQLGINQSQLARMLGVDNKYVNKLISGKIGLSSGRKLSIFYIFKDLYSQNNNSSKNN